MAETLHVGEKRCPKGHVIPVNGASDIHGKFIRTSHLICEICAIEAGGGETLEGMRHRPVSGRKLEKLGQESFLGTVPAKFIA